VREDSRDGIVAGIRAIETKLKQLVIDQEQPLKGLRDISGGASPRFFGARVGTKEPSEVIPEKRAVLAIGATGALQMVLRTDGALTVRDAADDELMAEDVERVAKLAVDILHKHAGHVSARLEFYEAASRLAQKIEEALSD
jgi:hypothetical protein